MKTCLLFMRLCLLYECWEVVFPFSLLIEILHLNDKIIGRVFYQATLFLIIWCIAIDHSTQSVCVPPHILYNESFLLVVHMYTSVTSNFDNILFIDTSSKSS